MKRILKNIEDTKKFSKEIEKNIFGFSNILIYGEVGTGKTTFTQYFLENIGVEKKIKSPSYALENFYQIQNSCKYKNIWHYDIYRLKENKNLESLEENFIGDDLVIVERAEKLNTKPQSGIELHFKKLKEKNLETGENIREVEVKFLGTSFSEEQIQKIFEKYKTPINIQGHTAQVTNTAIQVAEKFIKNGKILDKKLIYTAAKLHDVIKYIDFIDKIKSINGKYFDITGTEISNKTIDFWKTTKKKYQGISHEKAGGKLFYEMGYKEIGKTIGSHGLNQAFKGFSTFEEKIVYYADSVTMHHEKVSVKDRIEDVKTRYGNGSKEDEIFYKKIIQKNEEIERELEEFIL